MESYTNHYSPDIITGGVNKQGIGDCRVFENLSGVVIHWGGGMVDNFDEKVNWNYFWKPPN